MGRRRSIKSMLHNFLGTYTSRNSDYDGYWIFGFLVRDLTQLTIDLCHSDISASKRKATNEAVRLAVANFKDQRQKARLNISWIQSAHLTITRSSIRRPGRVNSQRSFGYTLSFLVQARSDFARAYTCEKSLFVAPHDPALELRSARSP
jgi:hypothetical protein